MFNSYTYMFNSYTYMFSTYTDLFNSYTDMFSSGLGRAGNSLNRAESMLTGAETGMTLVSSVRFIPMGKNTLVLRGRFNRATPVVGGAYQPRFERSRTHRRQADV
jgi:hypothetical protein